MHFIEILIRKVAVHFLFRVLLCIYFARVYFSNMQLHFQSAKWLWTLTSASYPACLHAWTPLSFVHVSWREYMQRIWDILRCGWKSWNNVIRLKTLTLSEPFHAFFNVVNCIVKYCACCLHICFVTDWQQSDFKCLNRTTEC